jgi:hypothetical protein
MNWEEISGPKLPGREQDYVKNLKHPSVCYVLLQNTREEHIGLYYIPKAKMAAWFPCVHTDEQEGRILAVNEVMELCSNVKMLSERDSSSEAVDIEVPY